MTINDLIYSVCLEYCLLPLMLKHSELKEDNQFGGNIDGVRVSFRVAVNRLPIPAIMASPLPLETFKTGFKISFRITDL